MTSPAPIGKHVWVKDGAGERPGLLVAWEKRGGAWWGRVVVVQAGEAEVWDVSADRLRPA